MKPKFDKCVDMDFELIHDKELAQLRADKERLDWLERFLQLGGSSCFTYVTGQPHEPRNDDTSETAWNLPFSIGHDVEIERGCYEWKDLSNGTRSLRLAIDEAKRKYIQC